MTNDFTKNCVENFLARYQPELKEMSLRYFDVLYQKPKRSFLETVTGLNNKRYAVATSVYNKDRNDEYGDFARNATAAMKEFLKQNKDNQYDLSTPEAKKSSELKIQQSFKSFLLEDLARSKSDFRVSFKRVFPELFARPIADIPKKSAHTADSVESLRDEALQKHIQTIEKIADADFARKGNKPPQKDLQMMVVGWSPYSATYLSDMADYENAKEKNRVKFTNRAKNFIVTLEQDALKSPSLKKQLLEVLKGNTVQQSRASTRENISRKVVDAMKNSQPNKSLSLGKTGGLAAVLGMLGITAFGIFNNLTPLNQQAKNPVKPKAPDAPLVQKTPAAAKAQTVTASIQSIKSPALKTQTADAKTQKVQKASANPANNNTLAVSRASSVTEVDVGKLGINAAVKELFKQQGVTLSDGAVERLTLQIKAFPRDVVFKGKEGTRATVKLTTDNILAIKSGDGRISVIPLTQEVRDEIIAQKSSQNTVQSNMQTLTNFVLLNGASQFPSLSKSK